MVLLTALPSYNIMSMANMFQNSGTMHGRLGAKYIHCGRKKLMPINKNELELLNAGYRAATRNNQVALREVVNKMARKFDHWVVVLQTGAILSLESIDLKHEQVHLDPVKKMMSHIGLQGHESTYSRLNTALVILRGDQLEINCLQTQSKTEMIASLLTLIGQSIFKKCGYEFSTYDDAIREAAENTLEAFSHISEKDKKQKRALAAKIMTRRHVLLKQGLLRTVKVVLSK